MKKPKSKTSSWSVSITIPERWGPNEDQIRDKNEYLGVVAHTMEEAIEEIRSQFPDCRLIGVHHRGAVHFQR